MINIWDAVKNFADLIIMVVVGSPLRSAVPGMNFLLLSGP